MLKNPFIVLLSESAGADDTDSNLDSLEALKS